MSTAGPSQGANGAPLGGSAAAELANEAASVGAHQSGMGIRRILTAALAAWLTAVLPAALAAVQAVDDGGTTVTLAAPALRIVSLAPHATELLYAAGAGQRVVGVLATSDWPPEVAGKPRVGDSRALDLERIVALAPDLVVTWPYAAPAQVGPLVARGVPVFIANPATIDGIALDLERLGTLAGTAPTATLRAAELRARLARLQSRYAGARTVRVFYEIWNAPLYTIGGDHLISQALRMCGGENVFAALTLPAPGVSVEAVLAARPQAILAGADGAVRPAWLDDWKRWPTLPAVALGNLYTVDANLLHRAGPRFVDGVEMLCATLAEARAGLR
jgi:iron complex transport system substrate-binding protein